jgi:putative ABC transport system permease protein
MPLLYAVKHVFRSWKLFLALLIGVILASTFFAGTDIKANATAKQALDQQLSRVAVDMTATSNVMRTSQILDAKERVSAIQGVTHVEIVSSAQGFVVFNETGIMGYSVSTVGIGNDSYVYDGWLNKPVRIGENETYIPEDSALATRARIGDVLQVNFSLYKYRQMTTETISINLTVKGFAKLDDKAYAIASGYYYYPTLMTDNYQIPRAGPGILLVDWEKTMQKLFNATNTIEPSSSIIATSMLIYFDHDALINAWDIDTSINNIKSLQILVENQLALSGMSSNVMSHLESILNMFRFMSISLRFMFTIVSLPIFFMAWYMGTTVSNVSFNLRRREIGLLLTKGFSRGQVQRLFLTETVVIGTLGGSLGVLFGFLLNPIFTGFSTDSFQTNLLSPYTVAFTIAFGIIIAVASTYSSAKKASQLPTMDALREYLPMEETKAYRKRLVWIAFILGTYKIAVFILGLNMTTILSKLAFGGGTNFILVILISLFLVVDAVLNYVGPLLFFWGVTKLLIIGSTKFQELTAKAAKFMGELGVLATKNVKMNPARSAAVAFLLALIVSYSVQVTGQLASEHDFAVRTVYNDVGADVSFYIPYANDVANISSIVTANLSSTIESSTLEYNFETLGTVRTLSLKAVDPQSWLKTAYYESGWFSGNDVATAFEELASDNKTIILRRAEASLLKINLDDSIVVYFGGNATTLRIVGFFGPESTQQERSSSFAAYWSYVSEELYEGVSSSVNPSTRMLIKLKTGVDGADVTQNIRDMKLNVSSVQSFAERWKETQSNVYTVGLLDIQRLGTFFAILAASVGTALVSAVSMKERGREATIMSVRGLSYKQLLIMFLTENLALVTFSVILGLFVGFITLYGNISSNNSFLSDVLILRRLVFTVDSVLTLVSCLALILGSTILPIVIMSRRYVTKLERMVRLR